MEQILRIADNAGIPVIEDNAHGLFGKKERSISGKLRPIGHAELSRDEKLFLWRGWRARYQRSLGLSIGPKSFGKRARIESGFSKVWLTSIHGSMWDRASCLQTCLRRSSMRNWKLGIRFKRNEERSGIAIIMN